jgi:hypothetical protein
LTGLSESLEHQRTNSVEEALRVLGLAEGKGVILRLLGGVAVYLRCPSVQTGSFARDYTDLDFVGRARQSGEIKRAFSELGYLPRERFNAMHGSRRLGFLDPARERRVDVFLDFFEMCHRFDLRERMEIDRQTIALADLLATKLQIVQTNEKDMVDMICLLLDHEVGSTDSGDTVNADYLAKLCGEDWGVHKTFTMKLALLAAALGKWNLKDEERELVAKRVGKLEAAIERAPKSILWKMRAAIGERVRWYELPEEDAGALEQVQARES